MPRSSFLIIPVVALCVASAHAASPRQQSVTGGPRGPNPYLFNSVSAKRLVETARNHNWSINFQRRSGNDSINIIALRVEFNNGVRDTSTLNTGTGLFSMRGGGTTQGDNTELHYYLSDTVYKYDNLPHDSAYFNHQLATVSAYFSKVSRGKLVLTSSVYPKNSKDSGYAVPQQMTWYSPGGKRKKETWDEYYYRKTKGLMFFIRDALQAAAKDSASSPFRRLRFEPSDSTLRDENNRKTVILIFHAGSSYLTDGGADGSQGRDTPSDMIDAFIDRSWFKYLKDSLKLPAIGVPVKGIKDTIVLDEVMMCCETSNQDGLNWGIQGILVNQVARQLGIPDLFSTSSGISAIGAFCIMDFAGYSAGNGFIPPYPSAWVRAFMGWDEAKTAAIGTKSANRVKAITSVLDRDSTGRASSWGDTTILLIPLNDHEYYLVENRQRNLSANDSLFNYDSTEVGGKNYRVIAPYPNNANIDSCVSRTSGKIASNVILAVKNNDVGLPASGVLVWHVDERVIRDRLGSNLVNADSLYRGVALVEADGVNDLGITFQDVFYQAAFDYGGAEDVFPHRVQKYLNNRDTGFTVTGFGPFTAPSSSANDGGHTWLKLDIQAAGPSPREELSSIRDYMVGNTADSVFSVSASWDYLVPGWPRFAAPENFFEPLLADLDPAKAGSELVLLSKSGRLYAWSTDTSQASFTYGFRKVTIDRLDLHGDSIKAADTVTCIDSIPGANALPSAVGGRVFIPSAAGITVLASLSPSGAVFDTIPLPEPPTSYVCKYRTDSSWAVGSRSGRVIFGRGLDTVRSVKLQSQSPVCAIAALREKPSSIAVMQNDGTLSIVTETSTSAEKSVVVKKGIGPFTIVSGDLNRDSASEIVVCDSRHGLWVYGQDLTLAPGWEEDPSDWPSYYHYSPSALAAPNDRSQLGLNLSAPALVDLNGDGRPDIVVGGTNGLYAFNYKGVLIQGWPSYLDNRLWYQRGSIIASPIALMGPDRSPLVVFSSPTGGRVTFRITKIVRADKNKGMVWFMNESNGLDSMWDLSKPLIDTLLTMSDSLVMPYITPGGFVDAVAAGGKRPGASASVLPQGVSPSFMSSWPLTTGAALTTAPLAGFTAPTATLPDLFAVAANGWVYRWKLAREILPDTLVWPQAGCDAGRSFAFGVGSLPVAPQDKDPISLYSYPNPTAGVRYVMFRYKFSAPASAVRFDIFTFSGFSVFSTSAMGAPPTQLTGSWPDWNELRVPVDRMGPAVYRCRMAATINGKKYEKFWKLAVTR